MGNVGCGMSDVVCGMWGLRIALAWRAVGKELWL